MATFDSICHYLVQKDKEVVKALSKHYMGLKDCEFLGKAMSNWEPVNRLDKLADNSLSVMTIKKPCKIIIEDLPEDPLCVYAPMYEKTTEGIFTIQLPSHIHVDQKCVQSKPLPFLIQLRHAIWLCVHKHEDGVYYARALLDHAEEQDLWNTIPWCPITTHPLSLTFLPRSHHTPADAVISKQALIDLLTSPPSAIQRKRMFMYPSIQDIRAHMHNIEEKEGYVVDVKDVGMVYVPCEGEKLVVLVDNRVQDADESADHKEIAQEITDAPAKSEEYESEKEGFHTHEDAHVDSSPLLLEEEDAKQLLVEDEKQSLSHTNTALSATPAQSPSGESTSVFSPHTPITTGVLDLDEAAHTPAATTPAPATSSNMYDVEPDHLTPSERREWKKKKEEYEKKKRLQDFLQVAKSDAPSDAGNSHTSEEDNGSSATKGIERKRSVGGGSIADRFEQAKRKQQEAEEERLNKIKNDTTRRVSYTKSQYQPSPSSNSVASPSSPYPSPLPPTSPSLTKPTKSMRNLWEDVLNTSKTSEETRFQMTKSNTISQFQLTKGTGIVKKRIGEWEELFVQIAATAEQLKEFLLAAQEMASRIEMGKLSLADRQALQEKFLRDCLIPEDFIINTTHVYSSYLLPVPIHAYLKSLLKESKYVALQCGVYGDSAHTPPICVYATVIMTHEQKVYVSVTIKSMDGQELIGGEKGVYGVKKIVVKGLDGQVIFEKLVNIIPEEHMIPYIQGYIPYIYSPHTQSTAGAHTAEDTDVAEDEGEDEVTHTNVEDMLDEMASSNTATSTQAHQSTANVDAMVPDVPNASSEQTNAVEDIVTVTVVEDASQNEDNMAQIESSAKGDEEEAMHQEDRDADMPVDPAKATDTAIDAQTKHGTAEDVPVNMEEKEGLECAEEPRTSEKKDETQETQEAPDSRAETPTITIPLPLCRKNSKSSSVGDDEEGGEGVWVTMSTPMSKKEQVLDENRDVLEGGEGEFDAGIENILQHPESDDDEGEDDEIDDLVVEGLGEGEEDAVTYNTFGRAVYLPTVTPPRSFAANPVSMMGGGINKHIAHKYSWAGEDECPPLYPPYHQKLGVVYTDLTEAHTLSCSPALFTIVCMGARGDGDADITNPNTLASNAAGSATLGDGRTLLFTCSLKHASTDSIYMTEGGKIFDWVRGAAKSGYMGKWPMASQNLGRVRRRFFVLRDHLLSYYRVKPQTEEKLYTRNTLCLNEQTSISIGRKYFTRCLIITTPEDTLWIRMYRDFSSEAAQWMHEMNKAIAYQKRQKLFMSMPRIETKWFHEIPSPLFNLVAVDHTVREDYSDMVNSEGRGYVTVGLFRLAKTVSSGGIGGIPGVGSGEGEDIYSLDVGSSDVQRTQLEVLNDLETPFLPTTLSTVKLYGGLVILGGSQGFVGVGVVSKTKGNGKEAGKRALIVFNVHNDPPNPPTSTPTATPAPYPHSVNPQNTIISIAVARGNSPPSTASSHPTPPPTIFATADSEGCVAVWSMPRSRFLDTLNPYLALSSSALRNVMTKLWPKVLMVARVGFLSSEQGLVFDKPGNSSNGKSGADNGMALSEKIVKLSFAPGGSVLVVSTTKRLLLLSLSFAPTATSTSLPTHPIYPTLYHSTGGWSGDRSDSITSVDFMHMSGVSMSMSMGPGMGLGVGVASNRVRVMPPKVLGWGGWVELDRTPPHLRALFDVCFEEIKGEDGTEGGMSMVEWKLSEEEEEVTGEVNTFSSLFGAVRRNSLKSGAGASRGGLRRCSITRVVWSPDMLSAAMLKQKPVI